MTFKVRSLMFMGLACGATVLAACSHKSEAPEADAANGVHVSGNTVVLPPDSGALLQVVTVATAPAQHATLPGRLAWDEDHTARVLTPFAGRVSQIRVKVGDHVAAKQPLAEILSPDFGAAQADARKAQAALKVAEHTYNRQKDLAEHGVSAARDVEQAEADYLSARAEVDRTQAQLKLVGDGHEGVDQRFALSSPVAGVVVERNLNPGQELRPDTGSGPLFVVTDPDTLWVMLDATEVTAPSVARGTALTLHVQQLPGQDFPAQLEDIADFFDPVTRTVKLRGRFDNSQAHLKGGTYVTADLPAPPSKALSAPSSTAFLLGADYYVFAVDANGGYTRRKVDVDLSNDGYVVFKSGVATGDRLIADGALFLERILEQETAEQGGKA